MKSKGTTAVLALLLGGLGAHRFYLGQTGVGIAYLFFCWTFIPAILAFLEFFHFAFMSDEKFDRVYNGELLEKKKKEDERDGMLRKLMEKMDK